MMHDDITLDEFGHLPSTVAAVAALFGLLDKVDLNAELVDEEEDAAASAAAALVKCCCCCCCC